MNGAFRHPLRVGVRLAWLVGEMAWIALNYIPRVVLRSDCSRLQAKARWLQWGCRRVIRIFNLQIRASGPIPQQGFLVSNHLSYLDILILSTLTPAVFVAKRDVKCWPVFGWFAVLAGTVFVDRERRRRVGETVKALEDILGRGSLAVLFPEGTSSAGPTVLPFRSALLAPLAGCKVPICGSAIRYDLKDGDPAEEVCYWKDMTLVPHILNLLGKEEVTASIRFSRAERVEPENFNRKIFAKQLHAEIVALNACQFPENNIESTQIRDGTLRWTR